MANISNQLFLVLGGASNSLGAGIVSTLLKQGAKVIVPTSSKQSVKEIYKECTDEELDRMTTIVTEVYTNEGMEAVKKWISEQGQLKHVITTTGTRFWKAGPILDQSIDELHHVLDDIAGSNFLAAKHFLPLLKDVDGSTYTIVTGISGEQPVEPNTGLLTVAEAALYGLINTLKEEFKDAKVRLNEYRVGVHVRQPEKVEEGMVCNLDVGKDLLKRVILDESVNRQRIELRTKDDLKI